MDEGSPLSNDSSPFNSQNNAFIPNLNTNNSHQQLPPQQRTFPQNFDFNSLPPAERELLLRRFQQQQQQQQQQQIHRAFQAQAAQQQNINLQRMTMNAYATPRPPLNANTTNGPVQPPQGFINPLASSISLPIPMQQQGPFTNYSSSQIMARPFPQQPGINPALLQQSHQKHTSGIKQINPQQFTNPLQASLKSDPDSYSGSKIKANNNYDSHNQASSPLISLNIPPFDEQVMSTEGNFIDHLIKFLSSIKFTNRAIPQILNRTIPLYRLFQVVISAGGFVAVGETKKWPLVAQALQFPAQSYEVVSTLRATYYTFLYAYEQYFIQKRPLEKIEWPSKSATVPQAPAQSPNIQRTPSQTSIPHPVVSSLSQSQSQSQLQASLPVPKALKFIPENELVLWKPFADAMKVHIDLLSDLDTAILYLNSPYFTLKIEALLATQKLFAQATPKEIQSAGISVDSLSNLLDSLESLWTESMPGIPIRTDSGKTMETFWAEIDRQKRDLINSDKGCSNRSTLICRQIVSLLRTLTVTKGSDVSQFLARSSFVKSKLLPFGLMETDDWEMYKDTLIIVESIGSHLGNIESPELLEWFVKQCRREVEQVCIERLTSIAAKFTGSFNLDKISYFDNVSVARQAVSVLITQSAQLWKSVPAHIFLHLSICLSVLTACDSINFDLDEFVIAIEKFIDIFVLPTVSLLRSVRALYECPNSTIDEVRRILETVIYSPSFSLTDGGFLELCLQLIAKCVSHQSECIERMNWTGIFVLLKESREFWRHSDNAVVSNLGKSCYQSANVTGSPAKTKTNNNKMPLAILQGSTSISAVFSHPFLILCKSIDLLASSFSSLPDAIKLDLMELSIEWNLDTPSKWGREILGAERIEESLKVIRDFYE